MNSVAIKTETLKETMKSFKKKTSLVLNDGKKTSVSLTDENKDLLEFLQDVCPLSEAQINKINKFLLSNINLNTIKVNSVASCYAALQSANSTNMPIVEMKIANRWYPLMLSVSKFKTFTGQWVLDIEVSGNIGCINYRNQFLLGEFAFEDAAGKKTNKTINEVLKNQSIRLVSEGSIDRCKNLNSLLTKVKLDVDRVYDATGTGLIYRDYWGWSNVSVGWRDNPTKVVIEPKLEDRFSDVPHENLSWTLPFVRVFSLKHKAYVYVDVEDLEKHTYNKEDKDKIVLPPNMMTALNSIFNCNKDDIFGDVFNGRHGGIVVLANGPSGVGKTLSAEVFAEYQERPLYTMEMGEIGTTTKEVEASLTRIFARAKKWNAVLLFDEADIFLSERAASDLERSAIVGIFLRLLDYYEGTFFLTTNRGDGIDKAFKSRVTLYLDYPELSDDIRSKIWTSMLNAAGLPVKEDDQSSWGLVSKQKLNGRQIRNQVRLLKLMYPDGNLTTSGIMESMQFTAK